MIAYVVVTTKQVYGVWRGKQALSRAEAWATSNLITDDWQVLPFNDLPKHQK